MRIIVETTLVWCCSHRLYWKPFIKLYKWGIRMNWFMVFFEFQIMDEFKNE